MGGIWPAGHKMPERDLLEMKLGGATKSDAKITKNPNMPRMTSL